MSKIIEVVPYDPNWPKLFELEAASIKTALRDNCITVHHIGSTSVPGLAAKPKIDMIAVVRNAAESIAPLEQIGFTYKGEWNIPFKYGFTKRNDSKINLHVFEEGHPEIELNLLFRDYLRASPQELEEYAKLKETLLSDDDSSLKQEGQLFSGYNLGKDAFIRKILKKADFKGLRFVRCTHHEEWKSAKYFRQKYFFDQAGIQDPYTWTFNHPEHEHFVLYQGTEIIGYAHIQLWPDKRAAMRIIVIEEDLRNNQFGSLLLSLCEKWLKKKDYKSIHVEASPKALAFYKKHGYVEMPFDDPEGYEGSECDTDMGKTLSSA